MSIKWLVDCLASLSLSLSVSVSLSLCLSLSLSRMRAQSFPKASPGQGLSGVSHNCTQFRAVSVSARMKVRDRPAPCKCTVSPPWKTLRSF